jgi:hypothetical protein
MCLINVVVVSVSDMAFKPTTLVCNKGLKAIVALLVEKIKQAREDLGNGHSPVTSLEKSPTSKEH